MTSNSGRKSCDMVPIPVTTNIIKSDDQVYVRSYGKSTPMWILGVIDIVRGLVSFIVQITDERVIRRHLDQVRPRSSSGDPVTEHDITAASGSSQAVLGRESAVALSTPESATGSTPSVTQHQEAIVGNEQNEEIIGEHLMKSR